MELEQEICTYREKLLASAIKHFILSEESAEDLVQDTIVKALTNLDKFDGSNLQAWLFRIMRNMFINQFRRSKILQSEGDDTLLTLNYHSPNTSEDSILQKNIFDALESIGIAYKGCINLRMQGYSYKDIANILELPIGTVKSRIHFGRKYLKRILSC